MNRPDLISPPHGRSAGPACARRETTALRLLITGLLGVLAVTMTTPAAWGLGLDEIPWVTNMDDPPIGDPAAKRGGTFIESTSSYPLTFRLVGPESADAFANWNRSVTMDFKLVRRHPTTDNYIPWTATHWYSDEDGRTVYFKLDPDALWSDGEPVTAEDYVFTIDLLRSEHIFDPFWNSWVNSHFESVEALSPLVIKVTGKFKSWRPLHDFNLWATPKHATPKLGPDWVKQTNLIPQVAIGPYVVTEQNTGQSVAFTRLDDWWGNDKHYFQGLYNVDRLVVKVIMDRDRAFDHFKAGDLSYYRVNTAKIWANDMEFDAIKKGWAHRKRVFIDYPEGLYGFCMNLRFPLFQNKDFRKAIQYAFNFDELNEKLMFGAYYRAVSSFTGTPYQNPNLVPYGFDPRKAREHLTAAGFTKRGKDGIFAREDGTRASFTLTYGSPGLTRHMTVAKQTFQRLGIEMKLELIEPGTAFERRQEKAYEMSIISQTAEMYPDPHQYFHSEFAEPVNNNNVFAFANEEADRLIDIYRFGESEEARLQAMHDLDTLIRDEAFYVPFWTAPFVRFTYWNDVQFPSYYLPKRFQLIAEWPVYWVDVDKARALADAKKAGKALGSDPVVDVDPYSVKAQFERSMGAVVR